VTEAIPIPVTAVIGLGISLMAPLVGLA
jgi:hypothetical protein